MWSVPRVALCFGRYIFGIGKLWGATYLDWETGKISHWIECSRGTPDLQDAAKVTGAKGAFSFSWLKIHPEEIDRCNKEAIEIICPPPPPKEENK